MEYKGRRFVSRNSSIERKSSTKTTSHRKEGSNAGLAIAVAVAAVLVIASAFQLFDPSGPTRAETKSTSLRQTEKFEPTRANRVALYLRRPREWFGFRWRVFHGGVRVPCMISWSGHIPAGRVSNGIQSHEDLFVTLAAAAGLPNLKQDLLAGYKMGDTTYKVHLDGYNNLDLWTGKTDKSARREIFYYDETDLMALRVDGWKMHIGVKMHNNWFDPKSYPSVPYVVNLLMDPMEKMTPDSEEYGYIGRMFLPTSYGAPTAAGPFLAAHLKSLEEFPPSQGADTLSMKKAVDQAMKKLENPNASSN